MSRTGAYNPLFRTRRAMNLPFASSPLLHRLAAVVGFLVALAVSAFAVAAALMYFWVLPNIADHRDAVAGLLSRALGQQVTLDAVSGKWQQARPEFRLQGVRLYDRQGRLALELPELEAAFAWRSLLFLEPRFHSIELAGLSIDVRRARDGHFYVGGIPVDPADPDSGFSSWILRQGKVHVGRATLVWLDETRAVPPLRLHAVDLRIDNVHRTHRIELHATPPADLARPVTIRADWTARDVADLRTWNGTVEAVAAGVAFPRLAQRVAHPYLPHAGWGALRVRFDIRGGALSGLGAGLDLRDVELALAADLPAMRLARVRGQASWQRGADGQRVALENLRVALPGGAASEPFDLGFAWNASARELTARALRLGGWQALLPGLPMDAALRARLVALQPRGRIETLRLGWQGAQPGLDDFSVDARFSGLGANADGELPGFDNLGGRIAGDARGGRIELDARRLALDLPALFREPRMQLDELRMRGGWTRTARGRLLRFDEMAFANADAAGTLKGRYEYVPGTPGTIDLEGRLTRAAGPAVYRYLPKRVGDHTVDWVRQGVLAGRSDDVRLALRGDLAHFPFDRGGGVFRVEATVKDGTLRYVPDWPAIEDVDARLLFAGRKMEVTAQRARIYGVALAPVQATIPDLIHHEEELHVSGQANGPVQDFIRFANFSPVGERLHGFTDALDGNGPMRLALNLRVPLRHSQDTTLGGRLSFLGNALYSPSLPRLEQVRGDVAFTGNSLDARGIVAQFLGGPLRVDANTQNGVVSILAQGRATAAGVRPWLGDALGARLSGQSTWRGRIDLGADGDRMHIESDLVGLGSTLPAPLAKAAAQPLPLTASLQPLPDGRGHEVRLGRVVGAVWRSDDAGRFARGEIRFGGTPVLPADSGLRLAGNGRGLDVSGWAGLLPDGQGGVQVSTIDLGFDAFDLMGRRFKDVRLQGRTRNGLLRTQVTGEDVSGTLTYRPAGAQPARVSAQFRQLVIPASAPVSDENGAQNMRAADFPVLDLTVDDFRLQDRALGRLEAVAHAGPEGLAIETLQLTHPDSVFRMHGLWRDGGVGETRAELNLSVLDAGRFLARFGYPDAVRRGSAEVVGNATWEGSPADFAFGTLAGQLDFKAKGGQFLKLEPGVGKLLGVLSLQSLPRRLNFDFRDIFGSGYAFDDIGATLRIARGVVYSDDFRMRGPAAKVGMSGLADLERESVQLRVKVTPRLSEGVAVAGALIGGPIAGVGALAAQKLLRDPVEEAISQEYLVSGPWQSPDVKRLPRTPAKQDTQAFEP